MKLIFLIVFLGLTLSEEINTKPLDTVKCLLDSEIILKDINKIIELIKEGDYSKLILELIEMYPEGYNEIFKCMNKEVNLKFGYGCELGDKDKCCWVNHNGCCKPPKRGQMCTQALRTCCKTKVYDETTGKYTIVVS